MAATDSSSFEIQKWAEAPDVNVPVSTFAADTLRVRFQAVLHYYPLAVHSYQESIDYIHQLRVSCRRANAALELFGEFLPAKKLKKVKTLLKKIRRSANDARNDDVLLARLNTEGALEENISKELLSRVQNHRIESQQSVVDFYQTHGESELQAQFDSLLHKVRHRTIEGDVTLREFGRIKMQSEMASFFEKGMLAFSDPEALHALRIEGKQLRYMMELLVSAFPKVFRSELYPRITELQNRLGEMNDHITAMQFFQSWVVQFAPGPVAAHLASMIQQEWDHFVRCREMFLEKWPRERFVSIQQTWENEVLPAEID